MPTADQHKYTYSRSAYACPLQINICMHTADQHMYAHGRSTYTYVPDQHKYAYSRLAYICPLQISIRMHTADQHTYAYCSKTTYTYVPGRHTADHHNMPIMTLEMVQKKFTKRIPNVNVLNYYKGRL
jgi:hypothetical protein